MHIEPVKSITIIVYNYIQVNFVELQANVLSAMQSLMSVSFVYMYTVLLI